MLPGSNMEREKEERERESRKEPRMQGRMRDRRGKIGSGRRCETV